MSPRARVDEKIPGDGWWIAERTGDRATVSEAFGEWGQRELTYDISLADFERLRDPKNFDEVSRKYNEVRGDGWTARRADGYIVYPQQPPLEDARPFSIPASAFDRLREDPASFDDVYRTYGPARRG